MKVAFVVTAFPTLSYTFILDKITGLIDRGHEVDVFADRPGQLDTVHPDVKRYGILDRVHCSSMPSNVALRYIKGAGLMLSRGWRRPGVMLRSLNAFRHGELASSLVLMYGSLPLLNPRSYDIIHGHFGPNGLKGLFFRDNGLISGKLITIFHGYDVNVYPRRRGTDVYRRLFERGDFFLANSSFLMDRARALGCPPGRIIKLAVGADLKRFVPPQRQLPGTGPVRVLIVGRLVEVKGVEYAVRAVALLAKRQRPIRLQIVGDGPLLQPLLRLANDLSVADRVEFLGGQSQDKVLELYAQADLFMLPSVVGSDGAEEGQGSVLTEAQAMKLPLVSTNIGGIPETVVDGQSGLLVPQRDPDALADALDDLIGHQERWAEMGAAGRRHVEQHFDAAKLNDELVDIYERVLDGRLG